jgi:hypothetical protein
MSCRTTCDKKILYVGWYYPHSIVGALFFYNAMQMQNTYNPLRMKKRKANSKLDFFPTTLPKTFFPGCYLTLVT